MTDATLEHPRPQIDDPEGLDHVVHKLVAVFDPIAIFLFGSRARREAWRDSDYDLMVVVRDDHPRQTLRPSEWWSLMRGEGIDANLSFSRESSYAWRRHEVGTLEYEVETDGVQLYPTETGVFVEAAQRNLGPANMKVVWEWLEQVQLDLDAATSCIHGPRAVPSRAAFLVQQAAEKLAKGALVAHRVRPEKTHRISQVVTDLPNDFPPKQRFSALERFSDYATAFRYPGERPVPVPSAVEVEGWIAEIEALKADFERWLDEAQTGRGA